MYKYKIGDKRTVQIVPGTGSSGVSGGINRIATCIEIYPKSYDRAMYVFVTVKGNRTTIIE